MIEQSFDTNIFGSGVRLKDIPEGKSLLRKRQRILCNSAEAEDNQLITVERNIERLCQWIDGCPEPARNKDPNDPWETVKRLQRDSVMFQFLVNQAHNSGNQSLYDALVNTWEIIPEEAVFEPEGVPATYTQEKKRRQLARNKSFLTVRRLWKAIEANRGNIGFSSTRRDVLAQAKQAVKSCRTLDELYQHISDHIPLAE